MQIEVSTPQFRLNVLVDQSELYCLWRAVISWGAELKPFVEAIEAKVPDSTLRAWRGDDDSNRS